jgi:hypothetical protein
MFCCIEVYDSPPVMCDDEEAIKHTERECRQSEEVHRCDNFTVIAEKCRPSLGRLGTPRSFPHPTQNGSLRDIEAEHSELTVDAWRSPSLVLSHHAEDQFAEFFARRPSTDANPLPRKPSPIQLEPSPMPADNGLGLNDKDGSLPPRPE